MRATKQGVTRLQQCALISNVYLAAGGFEVRVIGRQPCAKTEAKNGDTYTGRLYICIRVTMDTSDHGDRFGADF